MLMKTKVWNEVTTKENGQWIGEIWAKTNDGTILFDTVIDDDRTMFYHWLEFYTNTARKCLDNAMDIEDASACYLGGTA